MNKLEITTRGLSVIFNLWSLEAQCTCVSKNRWRYHSLAGYARRSSAGCQSGVASEVLFQASCLWGSWKTFLDSPRLHCTQPGETGMIFFNSSVLLCVFFFFFYFCFNTGQLLCVLHKKLKELACLHRCVPHLCTLFKVCTLRKRKGKDKLK